MKSDSKIYRFFFGRRGDIWLPTVVMMLILVPISIVALYFDGREHNAIASNPVFTKAVVSKVYSFAASSTHNNYLFNADSIQYSGDFVATGLAVGDSIGVVYQKDNPENNMTVFEFYDGPSYGIVFVFVILAIILAVIRWRKINRRYNDRCPELERSGACMIYRTPKEYIFLTEYRISGCFMSSHPIKFLPLDCTNAKFEGSLMEIFHASLHDKYVELKSSELIKAMKQRSWRQLYLNSTSVLIKHNGRTLEILPTHKASDKRLDWDYDRTISFDLDTASWKDIITSTRKLLNNNETDR